MGWDAILKAGKKAIVTAAKKSDQAVTAAGRSAGHAMLHPSQTLRGAGQAVKTATVGAAVGYVGWEKLTSDKSVARIVSDAVIGESATNAIAGVPDGVRELTPAEMSRLSAALNDGTLSEEARRMRVAGLLNSVVLAETASRNFELGMAEQRGQTENLKR